MRTALRARLLLPALLMAAGNHSWAQVSEDGFDPQVDGTVRCVTALAGGELWIGGEFARVGATPVRNLAKLRWDGKFAKTAPLEPNGAVRCLLPVGKGALWIGGAFTEISGVRRSRMARVVENDGSRLDQTFAPEFNGEVRCLLADGDGVLVGGSFTRVDGKRRIGLVRLLADGKLDAAFDAKLAGFRGVEVNAMARQVDGKIVLGGVFDMAGPQAVTNLARLHPDGALDSGFRGSADGAVHSIGIQADSHIVIGGDFLNVSGNAAAKLARLNRHGAFANTYSGFDDRVNTIAVQADGKILAGGRFGSVAGQRYGNLIRFSPDLSAEKAEAFADGEVFCLQQQSDGHLLIGGSFDHMDAQERLGLARLDSALRVDATMPASSMVLGVINTVVQQPDEKLLFAGPFTRFWNVSSNGLFRTDSKGFPETSFRPSVGPGATGVQVRRDGKLVVFGNMTAVNGMDRAGIARLLESGGLDTSFNARVTGGTGFTVNAIAEQSEDRLLLGGTFTHIGGVPRLNFGRVFNGGSLDGSFLPSFDGVPHEFIASSAGDLTIAGSVGAMGESYGTPFTRRYNPGGALVASFQPSLSGKVNGMCRLPDGKILIWGLNPLERAQNLTRIGLDGKPESEFRPFFNGEVHSVSVQADGSMMVLGAFTAYRGGNENWTNLRGYIHLETDLRAKDESFFISASPSGRARASMVQADGKLVYWGQFPIPSGLGSGLTRLSTVVPAVQELEVVEAEDGMKIVWERGGSAPQVERVWVSASTNGSTYGTWTEAQWIDGRWETGLFKLPARTPLWIRAQGRVPSTSGGDAGGLVQSVRQIFLEGEIDVALNGKSLISGDEKEVNLGAHLQGASPVRRILTITNRGNDLLLLGEVVVPEGFTAGALSADQLAPGEQATIELASDLSRAGAWTGELVIHSNDLDEGAFVVPLRTEVINPLRTSVATAGTVLNRKTGLREQTVRVRNSAGVTVPAFRVIVRGLPAGVEIRNASGQLPDGGYVIEVAQPLGAFGSTNLKLEYFFPGKVPARVSPRITTEVIPDFVAG